MRAISTCFAAQALLRAMRLSILGATCIIGLSGCAGVVVVDIAFDVQISGRDDSGQLWRAAPDDFVSLPRSPLRASPFPDVRYQGKIFQWDFESGALGGRIRSMRSGPVCFRFDQARLKSNFQQMETPMRVFSTMQFSDGAWKVLRQERVGGKQSHVPPTLCFSTHHLERFIISADTSEVFPQGTYFNIQNSTGETSLSEKGIGNWLTLLVPIEYEGKREDLDIKITVKDSKARRSYY